MARDEFVRRMEELALRLSTMTAHACTLQLKDPILMLGKRIVMGSHCDSVKNGGNYDGIEGVMTGMEVLETIVAENIPHKHPITAMIWTNEEVITVSACYDGFVHHML